MQRIPLSASLVVFALLRPLAPLSADAALDGGLFICDSSDDRVLLLEDVDASGGFEPDVPGEVRLYYDGSGNGPELSVPSHMEIGADGSLYLLDGGTLDSILVLRDGNGDGDANDDGEASIFYDNSAFGPKLATPNTLLLLPDGSLLLSDDGSAARRLVLLEDLNGDGDALDEGEASIVYDESSAALTVLSDPESIARAPDGALFVGDSSRGAVFRLEDRDGNGDYLGAGEASVFFQSEEPLYLGDIDALVVAEDGSLYAADEDTGLVLRLRDLDGDGDATGSGETSVFVDDSASEAVTDLNDMREFPGGGLFLLDGAADSVFLAVDRNGDGDALDEGEVRRLLLDGGEYLSTPSGLAYLVPSPPGGQNFLRGDANSDLRLNITDAVNILDFLFLGGTVEACPDALDADDTGALNISDPIYLLNYLFLGGSEPPPPFPAPGPDETEDDLSCADAL